MAGNDKEGSIRAMPRPFRIGLLTYPGCMVAGLHGFSDLLHATNYLAGKQIFETFFLGEAGAIKDRSVHNHQHNSVGERTADLILVPGFWAGTIPEITRFLPHSPGLLNGYQSPGSNTKVWGYCTGVCILAHAGFLRNETATTTWWIADHMKAQFPQVNWQTDQNLVHGKRIATAAGVMGYLPLALALIEQKVGAQMAADASRLMVLPRPVQVHATFQSTHLINQRTTFLRHLHRSITEFDAADLSTSRLAKRFKMSERTLQRKVKKESGETLAKFARKIKLSQVADRLSSSSKNGAAICDELGFSSESNMRRMFKNETGLTLAQYRGEFTVFQMPVRNDP